MILFSTSQPCHQPYWPNPSLNTTSTWAILYFLKISIVKFYDTMHGLSVKLPKWPIFCQNGHFGRFGLLTKSIFLLTDMMILWLLVWKLVQKIHWDQFLHTFLYYHHTQIRISEIPLYWGLYCKMPTFEPLIGSCWDSNHAELSRRRFQRRNQILATGFLKVSKYLSTSVQKYWTFFLTAILHCKGANSKQFERII